MRIKIQQSVNFAALSALIDQRIDERLAALRQLYQADEDGTMQFLASERQDTRTLEELFEHIEQQRWTPPPGAKSSVELIREDRDR